MERQQQQQYYKKKKLKKKLGIAAVQFFVLREKERERSTCLHDDIKCVTLTFASRLQRKSINCTIIQFMSVEANVKKNMRCTMFLGHI